MTNPYNYLDYDCDPASCAPEWLQLRCANRTARKAHTCENCGQVIQPGERYQILVGVLEGRFLSVAQHIGGCPSLEDRWDEEHSGYWWERPAPAMPRCPSCNDDVTERAELSGGMYAGAQGLRCPACGCEWLPF